MPSGCSARSEPRTVGGGGDLSMAERQFKYRWDRTWAEVPEDYLAFDGEMKIGRVHRMNSISAGGWYWAMNAAIEWSGSVAGTAETRDEACREVERQY